MRQLKIDETVCLDDLVDVEELKSLHDRLCVSIANAYDDGRVSVQSLGNLLSERYPYPSILDKFIQFGKAKVNIPKEIDNNDKLLRYIMFTEKTTGIASVISIFNYKISDDHKISKNYKEFYSIIEWIKKQDLYSELIQCNLVLSQSGEPTPIHDHPRPKSFPNSFEEIDEETRFSLWIRLNTDRKLFMYDHKTKTKHYIKDKDGGGLVFYWDSSSFHGADPSWNATYAFVITGIPSKKLFDFIDQKLK